MELSDRLRAVADLVTAGSVVCDVGCDHGYVPIYLVQKKICPKVIAMDVNAGPLARAEEHIRAFGLEKYIVTRLSDGVSALADGEADTVILAGMGGRLVIKILTEGDDRLRGMREAILQPQSDIADVRRFLRGKGYRVVRENIVYEDGKYYPMMKVTPVPERENAQAGRDTLCGGAAQPDASETLYRLACDRYGEWLLQNRHPVLRRFLVWEQEREEEIVHRIRAGEGRTQRRSEREEELHRSAQVRQCALSLFDAKDGGRKADCADGA